VDRAAGAAFLYLDGVQVSTGSLTSITSLVNTFSSIVVGQDSRFAYSNGYHLHTLVDEVRTGVQDCWQLHRCHSTPAAKAPLQHTSIITPPLYTQR
jgi:hypothetical protein